jgi:hypothetical protein
MNKLLILTIILVILLGLYWYQSKLDMRFNKNNKNIKKSVNRTPIEYNSRAKSNDYTDSESDMKDNMTLKSFNPEVLDTKSINSNCKKNNKKNKKKEIDSQFTDSDLQDTNHLIEDEDNKMEQYLETLDD